MQVLCAPNVFWREKIERGRTNILTRICFHQYFLMHQGRRWSGSYWYYNLALTAISIILPPIKAKLKGHHSKGWRCHSICYRCNSCFGSGYNQIVSESQRINQEGIKAGLHMAICWFKRCHIPVYTIPHAVRYVASSWLCNQNFLLQIEDSFVELHTYSSIAYSHFFRV